MKLISVKDTAAILCVAPKSLMDKRFRARIGLPATHIGRRVGFAEADVEQILRRGREDMDAADRSEHE
jgi:hypothetical protein